MLNYFSNHVISNGIGVDKLILLYKEQLFVLRSLGANIFSRREKKTQTQNQKKVKNPYNPKFELEISG